MVESTPHCLQQLQSGAWSTSTTKPLSLTQGSNGTAPSGSVPSPESTRSAISSQVPVGPTRDATGNAMPATFAEAATQLSFAEFFERCILSRALLPRLQPSPTLLQHVSTPASPHSAAFPDASTKLPLTEFFLGCVYSNDSLDRQPSLSAVPVVVTFALLYLARSSTEHHSATRTRGSISPGFSPWYPWQSSARATPFATCSCPYLPARKKERKYRPSGNPLCHRCRHTCWTWPFPEASACSPAHGQFRTGRTCWTRSPSQRAGIPLRS